MILDLDQFVVRFVSIPLKVYVDDLFLRWCSSRVSSVFELIRASDSLKDIMENTLLLPYANGSKRTTMVTSHRAVTSVVLHPARAK